MIDAKKVIWWLILAGVIFGVYASVGWWPAVAVLLIAVRVELMGTGMWATSTALKNNGVLREEDIDRVVQGDKW